MDMREVGISDVFLVKFHILVTRQKGLQIVQKDFFSKKWDHVTIFI
jgi:hypothetical protein